MNGVQQRVALAVVALALFAGGANAVPVTVDFSGEITDGELTGDTFDGFVTYEDTLVTGDPFGEIIELIDFEIVFNGPMFVDTFTELDAFGTNGIDYGVEFLDGDFLGVGLVSDGTDPIFELLPGFFDVSEAALFYDPPSGGQLGGTGDITYQLGGGGDGAIPEPASAAMLTIAVLCLAHRRRESMRLTD